MNLQTSLVQENSPETALLKLLPKGNLLWTEVDILHQTFSLGNPNYVGEAGHMARLYTETKIYLLSNVFFHLKDLEQRVLGWWVKTILFLCIF